MISKFEVTIYNSEVRKKVQAGEHHQRYGNDWADFRYIEIRATSEDHARDLIQRRFPAEHGFIIEHIEHQGDYE